MVAAADWHADTTASLTRDRNGRSAHWSVVAVLLALAWTAKLTTVFGIVAAVVVSKRRSTSIADTPAASSVG